MPKKISWGIAGLICGILSLILLFAPYFGLPLAILSVIFYALQKKHQPTGAGTTALILGIIGIVLNVIILIFFIGIFAVFSSLGSDSTTSIGKVNETTNYSNNPKVGSTLITTQTIEGLKCPDITQTTTYEFNFGESIQGNKNLYLYADFLKNVKFSEYWELANNPSSNSFMRDSFVCTKGSTAGESVNKLYCRPTFSYEPILRKNTVDSQGNIINTDYQYIKSFIFDITGKDINNANDLKNLKLESITCSTSSW